MMNHVSIHGRLTRDPDIRTTQSGRQVASFNVAVDRRVKQGEEKQADFISCIAREKTAEIVGKYFSKGKEIIVEGRLQTRSYEKDGVKRYVTEVVANNVEFCGKREDGGAAHGNDPAGFGGSPNTDDDIPF